MRPLAPGTRAARILGFVSAHCDQQRVSPTYREIAVAMGCSHGLVGERVRLLVHLGYVQTGQRAIRVTPSGRRWLDAHLPHARPTMFR